MAQINFRIEDDVKAEAETLFNSLGMNTTTALMIFIRQSLAEQAIPFHIRHVPSPRENPPAELMARIRDMEARRNCHVHELIDVDLGKPTDRLSQRRMRRGKALA